MRSAFDLQIVWNRLIAICEEQAQVMIRAAFSPPVRESGDISAGFFDRQGRMLAQAVTGTPGHINSMAAAIVHFFDEFPVAAMKPGDAYVINDPWLASGHLNDVTIVTPAFHRGRIATTPASPSSPSPPPRTASSTRSARRPSPPARSSATACPTR